MLQVIELCDHGSVFGLFKHIADAAPGDNVKLEFLDEGLVRLLLRDTSKGLTKIHREGIAHHDVSGFNLLIDSEGRFKYADLGNVYTMSLDIDA